MQRPHALPGARLPLTGRRGRRLARGQGVKYYSGGAGTSTQPSSSPRARIVHAHRFRHFDGSPARMPEARCVPRAPSIPRPAAKHDERLREVWQTMFAGPRRCSRRHERQARRSRSVVARRETAGGSIRGRPLPHELRRAIGDAGPAPEVDQALRRRARSQTRAAQPRRRCVPVRRENRIGCIDRRRIGLSCSLGPIKSAARRDAREVRLVRRTSRRLDAMQFVASRVHAGEEKRGPRALRDRVHAERRPPRARQTAAGAPPAVEIAPRPRYRHRVGDVRVTDGSSARRRAARRANGGNDAYNTT